MTFPIEFSGKEAVKRFMFLSTKLIYPDNEPVPKKENTSYQAPFLAQLMSVDVQSLAKTPVYVSQRYDRRQFAANMNSIFVDEIV